MERASNIFSWSGGIIQIATIWIWMVFYSMASGFKWLIAIAVVYTIVGLIILIARQQNVSDGEHIVAWGVITLLFISLVGGILTLCIPNSYGRYTYHAHSYYSSQSQQKPQENAIEEKKIDEYIFVKPSANYKASAGSIIKIIDGFYASTVGKRVASDDICEVIEVNGEYLTIQVDRGTSIFRAETSLDNVYIKVKNPEFIAQERKKQDELYQAFVPGANKETETDKFEEIKKYKELLDLNIITQEEFDQKKKELLG